MSEPASKKLKMSEVPQVGQPLGTDSGEQDAKKDPVVGSVIAQLEVIHTELDKITEKENEDVLVLEQKYKRMRQHYFNKRAELLESIPSFWSTVFTSHPLLCHIIQRDEERCFRYLWKLEIETPENVRKGYSIKLYFKENPYFKNDVLVKDFIYEGDTFYSKSTKIDWMRPLPSFPPSFHPPRMFRERNLRRPSFFRWFTDNVDASNDVIAEYIKDDIWNNSLQYYLVPDPDAEKPSEDEVFYISSESSSTSSSDTDESDTSNDSKTLIKSTSGTLMVNNPK